MVSDNKDKQNPVHTDSTVSKAVVGAVAVLFFETVLSTSTALRWPRAQRRSHSTHTASASSKRSGTQMARGRINARWDPEGGIGVGGGGVDVMLPGGVMSHQGMPFILRGHFLTALRLAT